MPTPSPTTPSGQDPTGQDPSGEDPTGQDPGDVPPGTTSTTPGQEETVTIDDGDRSISVTSPDGQGQVTVTVDDGSGEPKAYTLDFGEGSTPTGAAAAGVPGTGTSGTGQPQDFGPAGSGVPAPDQPEGPIQPGEDGRCVIQDGGLTITAERPEGSADTVVVTVDDGTGEPTTYSLDYSGEDGPTATPQSPSQGQPGQQGEQGQPSEAQAMYRQLDDQVGGVIHDLESQPQEARNTEPGSASPVERDPAGQYTQPSYAATSAQASLPSDGGSFFSHSDNGAAGQAGAFGAPDHGQYASTPPTGPGEAGLATAADGGNGGGHQPGGEHSGGGAMGMPMMGGVGGGMTGDQDRSTGGQWRTTGDLFDEEADAQLRGTFGEGR